MRYDRGGEPLWVSAHNKPTNIPTCPCGSEREFEFQARKYYVMKFIFFNFNILLKKRSVGIKYIVSVYKVVFNNVLPSTSIQLSNYVKKWFKIADDRFQIFSITIS